MVNGRHVDTRGRFGPDVVADYAIDFMTRHREEPFFVYYSAILTHIPVTTTPASPDEAASPREKFAGMVRYADHLVGRLVAALEDLGLRDRTLLFITADNGTDNGTDQQQPERLGGRVHGRISAEGIYSLAERGINVPLIVHGPGFVPAGRESDALLSAADVLPTLCELAGADIPDQLPIDGKSFASILRDGTDDGWTRPWTFTQYATTRVIRDQRFKLFSTGPFYDLAEFFRVPAAYREDFGPYRSPLRFKDGRPVATPEDWQRRRAEILETWHRILGPWPPLLERPEVEPLETTRRDGVSQRRLRLRIALGGQPVDAFLLVPDGDGPFPAVVVVYYDAQSGVGLGTPLRDFGWQLARRGFVTLSMGKPNTGVRLGASRQIPGRQTPYFGPPGEPVRVQPLSALAYAAANACTFLAQRPEVYPDRIGIVGHSFGGKWALFASCLDPRFACAVWSDPGIVFDERDRRQENPGGSVNYWDVWYLGFPLGTVPEPMERYRFRRLPSEGEPRTGSYRELIEGGHDLHELHALMAPRPLLVSGGTADRPERWAALNHAVAVNRLLGYHHRVGMTHRQTHNPTEASNGQIYRFFAWWLKEQTGPADSGASP